jgi:hypothetical protein
MTHQVRRRQRGMVNLRNGVAVMVDTVVGGVNLAKN